MTDKIDISAKAVAAIMEDVTKGRPVQFHPKYCEEAKDAPSSSWDTSHDLSVISEDGSGYRVATFRHASDAMFDQWAREAVPALSARLAEVEALLKATLDRESETHKRHDARAALQALSEDRT